MTKAKRRYLVRRIAASVVVVEPTGADTQVFSKIGEAEVTSVFRERHEFRAGEAIWPGQGRLLRAGQGRLVGRRPGWFDGALGWLGWVGQRRLKRLRQGRLLWPPRLGDGSRGLHGRSLVISWYLPGQSRLSLTAIYQR